MGKPSWMCELSGEYNWIRDGISHLEAAKKNVSQVIFGQLFFRARVKKSLHSLVPGIPSGGFQRCSRRFPNNFLSGNSTSCGKWPFGSMLHPSRWWISMLNDKSRVDSILFAVGPVECSKWLQWHVKSWSSSGNERWQRGAAFCLQATPIHRCW